MSNDEVERLSERAAIVKEVLTHRRSVRQFRSEPLNPAHLLDILESAIYAPSGSNSQHQRFLVIEDKNELEALGKMRFVWPYPTAGEVRKKKPAGLIGGAAAAVVVFADAAFTDGRDNGEYYVWEALEIQNCSASIENMLNMAAALGVGSCWLSAGERMTRTRMLSGRTWSAAFARYAVPESYKIQAIVVLGYPRASLDQLGYPKGEREHGATFWEETKRRPVDHYLVKKRELATGPAINLSTVDRLKLRAASLISDVLLRLLRRVERTVYDVEIKRALSEWISHNIGGGSAKGS